jgi:hypothetical protein
VDTYADVTHRNYLESPQPISVIFKTRKVADKSGHVDPYPADCVFEAEHLRIREKLFNLYVGNIKKSTNESAINSYFISRNVKPRFIKVLPNHKHESGNGAKLVVTETDYDKLYYMELPEGIYIRDWYKRETSNK